MMLTFENVQMLFKGPNPERAKALSLLAFWFCLGTFITSTLFFTFGSGYDDGNIPILGGALFSLLAPAIKLSL